MLQFISIFSNHGTSHFCLLLRKVSVLYVNGQDWCYRDTSYVNQLLAHFFSKIDGKPSQQLNSL